MLLTIFNLLVFTEVLITEFLESSSCLLRAAGTEINKIELLALNCWESTLSDVIPTKVNNILPLAPTFK